MRGVASMTYGVYSANVMQFGRESTAGTAVPATGIWRGPATDIEDGRVIYHPGKEESVGLLVPTDRTYVGQLLAMLAMPETELTFEQLPHILEAGIKTATPSGAGPYMRAYNRAVAAVPAIKTYTLEAGNVVAGDVHEMEYGFVESFTLSGKQGEAWKVSANWRGRQKTSTTLTSALSLAAVEEALFSKTSLYIDASGGTIGSTQKAGVLLEASIQVNTGIQAVFTGDGQLYFSGLKFTKPSLEYSITMELEAGGAVGAERTAHRNQALRLIRLNCPGSSAARNLRIDLAGKHLSFGSYQNSNENTTVQVSGEAKYSSTDALFFEFVVTNSLASL